MSLGMSKYQGWEDLVELLLAVWIIASPFLLGFFHDASASASLIIIGTLMFFFSQLGISTHEPWEEWVNIILAVFLITTPWLFGFAQNTIAVINTVASGLCVIVFALISFQHEYKEARLQPKK